MVPVEVSEKVEQAEPKAENEAKKAEMSTSEDSADKGKEKPEGAGVEEKTEGAAKADGKQKNENGDKKKEGTPAKTPGVKHNSNFKHHQRGGAHAGVRGRGGFRGGAHAPARGRGGMQMKGPNPMMMMAQMVCLYL